ncbi:Uncharacterised protein [Shigella dysenteriae]|uniref:Uncharacterized protein n=1 Tax=Shigella dysenteriae TaxID=622 RepID=A0A2X2JZP7_SHIDY|nr:Uncharacterised protein [Shigella dysenteriae]
MKTKKVWVKPQKSKLSLPAHMPDAHRLAVLVGMIIRVSVASGDDRTDDQRYPFYRNDFNMRTCAEILAGADGP